MSTTENPENHEPAPLLGLGSSAGLGPADGRLSVKVKRELFRFHSQQEWVNKGKSWYANCGVRQGFYLTVDAAGHVVHMGKCFMEATAQGLYPITVYELQTNWASGPNVEVSR